jgi:hypothetical protein
MEAEPTPGETARQPSVLDLRGRRDFDSIRCDPRFAKLLAWIGLPR